MTPAIEEILDAIAMDTDAGEVEVHTETEPPRDALLSAIFDFLGQHATSVDVDRYVPEGTYITTVRWDVGTGGMW